MQNNLQAYMNSPRTPEDQQAALWNFDQLWQAVVQSCSDTRLGDAGRRCINDRIRGGQWDWFSYYRDPIANDETPKQIAAQRRESSAEVSGDLFLFGGAALMLAALISGGNR